MHRQSCEATQLRGDQDEATLDLRMACLRRGRIELQAVIGELQTGRPEVLRNAHHLLGGLPPVSRCGDVDALRAEVEPPLPEDVESVHAIESLVAEARAARIAARYDVAAQRLDQAESLASSVRYGPVRTDLALGQGLLAERQGDYASAEEDFLRAMKLAATHEQSDELTLAAAQLVFVVGYAQHRVEEGLRYAQVARAVNVRDSEYEGATLGHTALVLQAQGKLDEALELHRRAVELEEEARSPDDEEVTDAWTNYASTLELLGRYEEAGRYHRKTLELRERALGADHPDVGLAHGNIGTILYAQGRYAAAEGEYRRALELLIPALGADHPHVATEHNNLANVLQIQGRHADAEQEHRRALAIWTAHFGADHPHTALSRVNLAVSLNYQERHEEAEQELRRAMEVWGTELQGEAHRKVAVTHSNLSLALRGLGKLEDAEAEQRRAIEIQRQLEPEHADIGAYRTQLGLILIDEGKLDEARTQLQQALALRERVLPDGHPQIDETREILAGL
jgi:tetratricopeptide (TPR) repeat protein